jgi:nucleotidyltransferase substrate binding protein (TIGR01987 family)
MTKLEASIRMLLGAVQRLQEVLQVPLTDIVRDSAVKRFEISMDVAWKAVKAFLEERHGIACNSAKHCFREAFKQGLINYDERWLELIDLRNEAAHIYDVAGADRVYANLPDALKHLTDLAARIQGNGIEGNG